MMDFAFLKHHHCIPIDQVKKLRRRQQTLYVSKCWRSAWRSYTVTVQWFRFHMMRSPERHVEVWQAQTFWSSSKSTFWWCNVTVLGTSSTVQALRKWYIGGISQTQMRHFKSFFYGITVKNSFWNLYFLEFRKNLPTFEYLKKKKNKANQG